MATPGPGRIDVVGACSLIVPDFCLTDDLLAGEVLLQQHHFGSAGIIDRNLIRNSRGRLILSAYIICSMKLIVEERAL